MLSNFHINVLDEPWTFLGLHVPQLKLEWQNCQKSYIKTNSLCCSVLFWTSFCFLQVNQQKRGGMVSTNNINIPWTDLQTFFSRNHPTLCFWLRRGWQVFNTEQIVYQTQEKHQTPEIFYKNGVLENFAIFTRKNLCENTYFEEHLRMAASKLTLRSECLKLCFWIAFKIISVQ